MTSEGELWNCFAVTSIHFPPTTRSSNGMPIHGSDNENDDDDDSASRSGPIPFSSLLSQETVCASGPISMDHELHRNRWAFAGAQQIRDPPTLSAGLERGILDIVLHRKLKHAGRTPGALAATADAGATCCP